MKSILLQYPDEASLAKILDDLTVLSRNIGQQGHRATAIFDSETTGLEGLATKCIQRAIPYTDADPGASVLADDQTIVTDGDIFNITGGTVTLDVGGGEVTGGTFAAEGG